MDLGQADSLASIVTLALGMLGMFFGLKTQVKVLESQVEKLEEKIRQMEERNQVVLDELRSDIKQLLSHK